jgi:hypothetical protein
VACLDQGADRRKYRGELLARLAVALPEARPPTLATLDRRLFALYDELQANARAKRQEPEYDDVRYVVDQHGHTGSSD